MGACHCVPHFFWVPKKSTNPPRQHLLSVSPIVLDADCHGHKTPIEVEAKVSSDLLDSSFVFFLRVRYFSGMCEGNLG